MTYLQEIEVVGGNHDVFPELASWEWPIATYLFLGGLVAGLMIFAGTIGLTRRRDLRRVVAVADLWMLPILTVGLALLWFDLSNRLSAWRLFVTFQPRSAMSWGSWILLAAGLVGVVRLVLIRHRFKRHVPRSLRRSMAAIAKPARRYRRGLDIATVALGIAVGVYTGVLLSSIAARPLWDSIFLAPLFLVSGMAAGGAFLCLFIGEQEHRRLAPVAMSLCGVELVILGSFLGVLLAGSDPAHRAADVLIGGGYGFVFWGIVVMAGLLIPLTIEVRELRGRISAGLARAAPVLKLTGAATLRFVVLFAGLETFL